MLDEPCMLSSNTPPITEPSPSLTTNITGLSATEALQIRLIDALSIAGYAIISPVDVTVRTNVRV